MLIRFGDPHPIRFGDPRIWWTNHSVASITIAVARILIQFADPGSIQFGDPRPIRFGDPMRIR